MYWNRQSYNLFDWLGDVGGLYDALFIILSYAVNPITAFKLKTTLLSSLFRFKEKEKENVSKKREVPAPS